MRGRFIIGCRVLLLAFAAVLAQGVFFSAELAAQEKVVYGVIKDKATGKPIDLSQVEVIIYAFNTVAEAKDVMETMSSDVNTFIVTHSSQAYPDRTGYYEINVAPTGALLYKADMVAPVMEIVNGRSEINLAIEVGNRLTEAVLTEERDEVAVMDANSELVGNTLMVSSGIALPSFTGKRDARLIVQPVLLDRVTKDTLRYLRPLVVDGKEYTFTQNRRMNFDMETYDPLRQYVSKTDSLTEDRLVIPWNANIYVRDPNKEYLVLGLIQIEDYNRPYFYMEEYLASMRTRRPLRWLRYSAEPMSLKAEDYYVAPRREKMSSGGSVSLNFEKNKAVLAADDAASWRQLDSLKKVLLNIVNGEGTSLREMHIVGTTSPEGSLEINTRLAKQRTEFALNEIMSALPKYNKDRVWSTAESIIRTWEDVALLIDADAEECLAAEPVRTAEAEALMKKAATIREIIAQHPGSVDAQGRAIAQLSFYDVLQQKYLPKLRSVSYSLAYDVNRALTPDEILHRWRTDNAYRSGERAFTLHEYWQLFQMLNDKEELAKLYKMAYDETKRSNGMPWEYAAGLLSESYIEKGIVDTTVLAPFVDLKIHGVNVKVRRMDGTGEDVVNPAPIVFNQMVMYLNSKNFSRASQLSQLLPDAAEYAQVKAYAMVLGGYFYGGDTPEEIARIDSYFNTVCESSTWNKVILCMARGLKEKVYNRDAEEAIELLPDDEPMKFYFKAILLGRKGYDYLMESEGNLYKACKMDPTLIEVAAGDGDMREDSVEEVRKALEDTETGDLIYGFY